MTDAGRPLPEAGLAALAHDFNNLLGVIAASADAARERATHDPALLADLDVVTTATERGAALIRTLLGLGGQSPPPSPQAMDLNAALQALTPLLRRILGSRIALHLVDGNPPLAWLDPVGLDRVVLNLAANARDAMPAGGRLTLRTGHADGYAALEVADTGEGIAPDLLPTVLEPGVTTKATGRGHGLGLASVAEIMRRGGGRLAIESAPGAGTTVRLHFPATAPPRQQAGRLVLLVEDETPVRNLATRKLSRLGWQVLAADSAESALSIVESRLGDLALVVADLALPGNDGLALIRDLRARRPDLPAVLASGYAASAATLDGPEVRLLPKPYSLDGLAQACAEAAERS